MIHQVFWAPDAEQELAEIWLDAEDRGRIATASHMIDTALRLDPGSVGESRDEGRRIFWEPPLGVLFAVSEPDRTASVLNVWRFHSHRKRS